MRILPLVVPTPEQLPILLDSKPGALLVRGAAGSGKTTTALMRLKQLCATWLSRRRRLGLTAPVRVLVLTYNRTLEGYIAQLAADQVAFDANLQLEVRTFGKWATELLPGIAILDREDQLRMLRPLCGRLGLDTDFLADEVDYVLGRFPRTSLTDYLSQRRTGRGTAPRMDTARRTALLNDVIAPYTAAKAARNVLDWNDIAVAAATVRTPAWDVVVIDEAQDFSANQVRTVLAHLAPDHSITFVMDAVQRIYPRFFAWTEVGIKLNDTKTLKVNHRNTRQIAAFARPLVESLPLEDDGALPDFNSTNRDGPLPEVLAGTYSDQTDHMIDYIRNHVDLAAESAAFLQPRGGRWFGYLESSLRDAGMDWVRLTRASTWPAGKESIALCTLHSAKGLEFDHVFLPGLNQQVTPHGADVGDARLEALQRLVAMGVGRARTTLMLGYKPGEESTLVHLLVPGTFKLVTL